VIRHILEGGVVIEDKGSYAPQEINENETNSARREPDCPDNVRGFAQTNPPSFEVASIKQAAPQEQGKMMVRMGGDAGRGRLRQRIVEASAGASVP
jgi:hypothetical protein